MADFVNFGVAPGLILYFWQLHDLSNVGWIASMIFAISGGLRLARFNATMDDPNKLGWPPVTSPAFPRPPARSLVLLPIYLAFLGMPTPPAAVTTLYTLLIAILMVSRLPVISGKTIRLRVPPEMVLPVFVSVIFFIALLDPAIPGISFPPAPACSICSVCLPDGSPIATMNARPRPRLQPSADVAIGGSGAAVCASHRLKRTGRPSGPPEFRSTFAGLP